MAKKPTKEKTKPPAGRVHLPDCTYILAEQPKDVTRTCSCGMFKLGDAPKAYALVPSRRHPTLYHLAVIEIKGDKVESVELDTEDHMATKVAKIEGFITRHL